MKTETINLIIELRSRILRCLFVLFGSILLAVPFANQIYHFLALPILNHFSAKQGLIAINVPAPFLIPFKGAVLLSFFVTMPYLLYQFWMFLAPALYRYERKLLWLILLTSSSLFYLGVFFSYVIVLPIMFKFFIHIAPSGVEVKPDISQYFQFIVQLFFAFGLSFEMPIAIMLLVWANVCSIKSLANKRPYIILCAFIVGMVLTPPDVISQILLAIPLWLLFELGLVLSRYVKRLMPISSKGLDQ